ncbi:hypothetical protein [Paucibacter sp. M5-1]|uniref:hypothetical protein n=1 Tax=Paucibacter sp. M5-1 TaxID=3015998 RepID=UPI0022B87C90|nr:hypothetical protein [Paucibacter sp. M5-1]MCZ7884615.1 hypothetical protein [Paucibacter sp. M5-1]
MKFPTNAFPAHIDAFLEEMASEDVPLWMPVKLDYGGALGAAPLAVQAIATWAERSKNRLLRVAPQFGLAAHTRERFSTSLPGMAALYFANSVEAGQIVTSRFEALKAVAPQVNAMNTGDFRNTVRGQGVALVCFAGARNEFLHPLYCRNEEGSVRGNSDFKLLLTRVLQALSGGLPGQLLQEQLDLVSSMIHQLFLNTDQHGASDVDGRRYPVGVRGFVAKLSTISDVSEVVRIAGPDTQLKAYLSKASFAKTQDVHGTQAGSGAAPRPAGQPVRMLELSVFDSGPGMGLRWLAKKQGARCYDDFSPEEELEAVLDCFEKHATTKAAQDAGVGLYKAVKSMRSLNAFMTLRTGRTSLYQDFSSPSAQAFAPKPRSKKTIAVPRIAGTGYTICFKVN